MECIRYCKTHFVIDNIVVFIVILTMTGMIEQTHNNIESSFLVLVLTLCVVEWAGVGNQVGSTMLHLI